MAYQRPAEFEVARVTVSVGSDGQKWSPAGVITNESVGQGAFEWNALVLSGAICAKARYLKLGVQHSLEASRLLLGEIVVEGPAAGDRLLDPPMFSAARENGIRDQRTAGEREKAESSKRILLLTAAAGTRGRNQCSTEPGR